MKTSLDKVTSQDLLVRDGRPSSRAPDFGEDFATELRSRSNAFNSNSDQFSTTTTTTTSSSPLKFSNHAVDRMRARGIQFNAQDMTRLEEALSKAQQKGAKETLVLMDDRAAILNVRSGTVITVMDRTAMKENVFTNIDSTVVI